MTNERKLLTSIVFGAVAGGVTAAFILGALGGQVTCPNTNASYLPLPDPVGVFAYASTVDTVVVTTGGTYYQLENIFTNGPMEGFTLEVGPPVGIHYDDAATRWFQIAWSTSVSGDANGMTVYCGVAINGTTPEVSSLMGTYLKTANEVEALSGTSVIELDQNDVVTLVLTADGDLDEVTVHQFTTSLRPFFISD
jgi:hypothetical protein